MSRMYGTLSDRGRLFGCLLLDEHAGKPAADQLPVSALSQPMDCKKTKKKKKKTPKLIVCTRLKRPHSWMHRKETWIAAMQLWDKLTVCCRNSFTVYFTQFPIRIVEFWILIVHYHIYNDNDWDLTIKVHYHCGSNCTNPIAVQV